MESASDYSLHHHSFVPSSHFISTLLHFGRAVRYPYLFNMAAEQPELLAINPKAAPLKMETTFVEDIGPDGEKGKGSLNHVMNTFNGYYPEHAAQIEKKLVKRIDIQIMPLVVLIYIFSYLDRNSVS